MRHNSSRYFLAILPPEAVSSEVMRVKSHFSEVYDCKAPLRSPPHITLHMPFLWQDRKEAELINLLTGFANTQSTFDIELKDYGAFPPKVIYIQVNRQADLIHFQAALSAFAKRNLRLFNPNHRSHGYHPHMTVAFRDLKKPAFEAAWEEFKDKPFEGNFEANSFWLLKRDGKRWHAYQEFYFGSGH